MNTYIFNTAAAMKEYNRDKWWIDCDVIKEIEIDAENITAALKEYQAAVADKYYIDISNNALKNKSPMYQDYKNGETRQIGYVITASTDFESNYKWIKQYIDLWVEIRVVKNAFMEV